MTGRRADDVTAALERGRARLMEARAGRPRPHLDDKVLTAWNGLAIGAFARAGRTLPEGDNWVADADRAARFIRERLWDGATGTLLRRYRRGDAAVDGYAEDYAFLIAGVLDLFQADGNPEWLEWAVALQSAQDERFWDPAGGGWFSTTGRDPSVLLRLKEEYDGAEPSASSAGVFNLLSLWHLTADETYRKRAEQTLGAFVGHGHDVGRVLPMMLAALSVYHAGTPLVVILGARGADDTRALLAAARGTYLPAALVVPIDPADRGATARLMSWTAAMAPRGGAATAYVCRGWACQAPTTSPDELASQLTAGTV